MSKNIILWILRLVAAVIMLQTLYFKFTGAEESIYIFSQINMEPWGRYAIGSMELIASILVLIPRSSAIGALLGIGLMSGAAFFHLSKLGIEVQNDGGQLFCYAVIVWVSCAILVILQKEQLIQFTKQILKRK